MTCEHTTTDDLLDDENNDYYTSLNQLADHINTLNDRMTISNAERMINESRGKLDTWRVDCYKTIDQLYEQKCREINQHVTDLFDKQRKEINRIRSNIAVLIHKQDISRKDIDYIAISARLLEKKMNATKEAYLHIDIRTIEINENSIQIHQTIDQYNSSNFPPPYRTIKYLDDSSKSLANNDHSLLIHHNSNLCLLDKELNVIQEKSWVHDSIMDMCWSSILARFLVLTRNYIFLIDESTMSIIRIQKIPKQSWGSLTCSDADLYVTTKDCASNIYQFHLRPTIQFHKCWQPPQTCKTDETINDIIYNNQTFALIIYNHSTKAKFIELCISETFERLWSLNLDMNSDSRAIRSCSLNDNEWLVVDGNTSHFFHISKDGKMKFICDYYPPPFYATMFTPNLLVVSTEDRINLHKL